MISLIDINFFAMQSQIQAEKHNASTLTEQLSAKQEEVKSKVLLYYYYHIIILLVLHCQYHH